MPGAGLEPTRENSRRILSPLRLPFRHPGVKFIVIVGVNDVGVKMLLFLVTATGQTFGRFDWVVYIRGFLRVGIS